MSGPKNKKPVAAPAKKEPPITNSGVLIQGQQVRIKGDIAGHDLTKSSGLPAADEQGKAAAQPKTAGGSSWANGMFYLFVFLVVAGALAGLAHLVDVTTLVIIIFAGLLAIPLVGAFQLKMDRRLSDKSFLELAGLAIQQLPLFGKMIKK